MSRNTPEKKMEQAVQIFAASAFLLIGLSRAGLRLVLNERMGANPGRVRSHTVNAPTAKEEQ